MAPETETRDDARQIKGSVPRGSERILVVDDDEAQAGTIKEALGRLGYRVTAETDSHRALDLFLANPGNFDLVVTDQTMPGLTGMEMAEAMARIRPDLPVVLCTGHSAPTDGKTEIPSIRDFLMKPFSIGEIAKHVRNVLDSPRTTGSSQ